MSEPLIIPKLGQTVEEVTMGQWLAADGSPVKSGQEVLNIETDKATFAVEATADGYLHFGPFKEGDVVPVFAVVAVIGAQNEGFSVAGAPAPVASAPMAVVPETPATTPAAAVTAAPASTGVSAPAPAPTAAAESGRVMASPRARSLAEKKDVDLAEVEPTGPVGRILERDVLDYLADRPKVTPVARKLAAESGVDVAGLSGSGPGGRITRRDVEHAGKSVAAKPVAVEPGSVPVTAAVRGTPVQVQGDVRERVPLKGIRGIIADRMGTSVHTTARVTLVMEIDATEFVEMRERLKAKVADTWGFAPGYNDLLAKMVAAALVKFPYMNARLTADAIEQLASVNMGMAVDTDRGLLVPVIRNADRKSLREFGTEFRDLADRARKGKALPDELSGGTFTITSLGAFDVDAFTPVINLPEAAILGVGRIAAKAVVRDGAIVVRQMWTLSLVFDHRLVDGAPAARFLQYIKQLIEEPYLLLAI